MTANLKTIAAQMRIALHRGQISRSTQARVMRRLKHPALIALHEANEGLNYARHLKTTPESDAHWEAMRLIQASIHAEVDPIIEKRERAQRNTIKGEYLGPSENRAVSTVATSPVLTAYEYTPEWWREAEARERAEKRRDSALAYLEKHPNNKAALAKLQEAETLLAKA